MSAVLGLTKPWLEGIGRNVVTKSICMYLLQRYLGRFLKNKLSKDQFQVDVFNGTGTLEKISLDIAELNDLSDKQNFPIEFVDGFIGRLEIEIPWTKILQEPCVIKVTDLIITIKPKQRNESATSMFESMWNSMTSSMQLAEECAKQDAAMATNNTEPYEGLEMFAKTIDSILSRVKVSFLNTAIHMEHLPKDSMTGVGLIINIELIEYLDESGNDPPVEETNENKGYVVQSFTTKKFSIQGISFWTCEFKSEPKFEASEEDEDDEFKTLINQTIDTEDGGNLENLDKDEESNSKEESPSEYAKQGSSQLKNAVLFGKVAGRQEIRVKLKDSEKISGPKIAIEMNLASLVLFLSPRQVFILKELLEGLSNPDIKLRSFEEKNKCIEKPMSGEDFQRVEQELQQQLQANFSIGGLQGYGWSGGALEDEECDEDFHPLKSNAGMYDSSLSMQSSSMDSSMTSMQSSTTDINMRNRKVKSMECDPTAEITHFQIRMASLALILLHEDLIVQSSNNEVIVDQMQQTVDNFFNALGTFVLTAYGSKDFELARKKFDSAVKLSHIRILAAPVQAEADEKTTSKGFSISGSLTAAKLEILECLSNINSFDCINLLSFKELSNKPSLKLNFKHSERNTSRLGPKTELDFYLQPCQVELDLSLMDRIATLLNPVPLSEKSPFIRPPFIDHKTAPKESRLDIKVFASSLNLRVSFPIPDYRPPHDMNRSPWWSRNVRPDFILLNFSELTFQTAVSSSQAFQDFVFDSSSLDIFYCETSISDPIHLAKASRERVSDSLREQFVNPKLSIKVFPGRKDDLDELEEPEQDIMTQSCYGAFANQEIKEAGPFSSKRVVHESDTPHGKPQRDEAEELIIPGDKEEVEDFVGSTKGDCQIRVDLEFPVVSMQFVSKHVYELVYNRIANDLLLWVPSAPKPKVRGYEGGFVGSLHPEHGKETFAMCKSGIQYDTDSESDDYNEDEDSTIFFSTYDKSIRHTSKTKPVPAKSKAQSSVVIDLNIGKGLINLYVPAREVTTNNVIPGQHGEFLINAEQANVFIVSGYKGNDNLGYVCVRIEGGQIYHSDMTSTLCPNPPLKEFGSAVGKHLFPTIYKSDKGILVDNKSRGGDRDMLTVAIKIQANHETHHVKTVKVAVGVNKGTLRHRMTSEPNSWISHLIDFFNVQDYPIPGYQAKDVLTELHLHLWDCAVDYRPLHLPLRACVTVGNFSMSSHLSAQANSSTLHFIAEECGLFLSDKYPPRNGLASSQPIDLKRDFVNVIEIGLFELSLKTNDKKSGINPHIDLRASNNLVRIRTCADSGRALMQLITYYANDGDLGVVEEVIPKSPKREQELVSVEPQDVSNLSESQHENVNELLGDAMKETETVTGFEDPPMTGAQLFFFPDESSKLHSLPETKQIPQVITELGDFKAHSNKSSDTDDEFCFVGSEPGLGQFPKNGIPEINWLTNDPVRVLDNHFGVPVGKTDLLKPPKHFPIPKMRYTLCEMSLIWQMFGGNDFKDEGNDRKMKTVNFSDKVENAVSFKNITEGEAKVVIENVENKKKKLGWIVKGGVNRNQAVLMELQLNKVRFQHEVYPDHTKQASRQVLIISDVEIRDRLEASKINKFLYQHTTQARPKQAHAHMLLIKALHIRPDLKLKTQECCLKISILPLRLNIDQDSLQFLIGFFNELGGGSSEVEVVSSKHNTPTHQPPVMTVEEEDPEILKQQAQKIVDENLLILLDDKKKEEEERVVQPVNSTSETVPVYFRNVVFSPEVPIRLDYHGKRVDMSHGSLQGLLMGLGQLNCSELKLKRISHRHGLLGFDKLMAFLLQEWLEDIKRNQIPSLLSGVGPVQSLVQLFHGVRDLFWLPIEQYQKDGRIVRGLQRGANSFTTSTAMAALELTSRIIHLIQITAETAYDMLSPGPSVRRISKTRGKKKRYGQPQDIREGMANAYLLVKEGLGETADNIVQVASHQREQKGYSGAFGGVMREIPATIIKPIIIASEATTNVLGGMRSQLVPDARREATQKWRGNEA